MYSYSTLGKVKEIILIHTIVVQFTAIFNSINQHLRFGQSIKDALCLAGNTNPNPLSISLRLSTTQKSFEATHEFHQI